MIEIEIWKELREINIDFENYKISNLGNVLSKSRYVCGRKDNKTLIKEKLLKVFKRSNGYFAVNFRIKAEEKQVYLHRLLALAFIPKVVGKEHINHINGIKTDNRIENLEWCTNSENVKHAFKTGLSNLKGVNNNKAVLTEEQVLEIRTKYKKFTYDSVTLAYEYNVSRTTIGDIINKKSWKHI